MHFRNVWSRTLTSLFLGLLVAVTPVLAQSDPKVNKLAEGVYEIEHHGDNGNTMVIIGERQASTDRKTSLNAALCDFALAV